MSRALAVVPMQILTCVRIEVQNTEASDIQKKVAKHSQKRGLFLVSGPEERRQWIT